MTDFEAKVLRLWDKGMDTLQIKERLQCNDSYAPLSEAQVYRALNAARVERRMYEQEGGVA